MLRQHGSFLFVGVPNDAHDFYLLDAANKDNVQGLFWKDGTESPPWIVLPDGQYSIVGLCNDLTEEQWEQIVKWRWDGDEEFEGTQFAICSEFKICEDYLYGDNYDNCVESGFSLLRSLGFEPGQKVLAIKIEK